MAEPVSAVCSREGLEFMTDDLCFSVKLPREEVALRVPFLLDYCKDKSVLHLGCADSGLLTTRLDRGNLLHCHLAKTTALLFGVDQDEQAIERMRAVGIENLYVGSVYALAKIFPTERFDVILAGEILEHLRNPGIFLDEIRTLLARKAGSRAVITVPNSYSWRWYKRMCSGNEFNHPDHNFMFSFRSLRRLLETSGLVADRILPCSGGLSQHSVIRRLRSSLVESLIYRMNPYFADGLIAVVRGQE